MNGSLFLGLHGVICIAFVCVCVSALIDKVLLWMQTQQMGRLRPFPSGHACQCWQHLGQRLMGSFYIQKNSRRLELSISKTPAQKVGTRSRQYGPKVSGRFAFPGARNPRICSMSRFGKNFPVRVARLQNEVGTKYFFRGTNFLTKNAPKFSPNFLSLYFVGQKKSRKIPGKFPAKFPSPKSKKITDELL